jgi:transcription elongation factor GreA
MALKNTSDSTASNCTLGQATTRFFISLPQETKLKAQQEINKFARWYGGKRLICELTVQHVSDYIEQINLSGTDSTEKLEPIKDLLIYAYKQGLLKEKLALQIKIKKTIAKIQKSSRHQPEKAIVLTAQGYSQLEAELASLKNERPRVTEEIRKAAADKDFRENAPLEAAREYKGRLEGRILELEESLKKATIINENQSTDRKIRLGDTVILKDMTSGEQLTYTLVDVREANPLKGKISTVSPIGKALSGKTNGDTIEVLAPAGAMSYKIKDIKQN